MEQWQKPHPSIALVVHIASIIASSMYFFFLNFFFPNSLHKLFVQSCISFDGNNAFFTTGLQNGALRTEQKQHVQIH